MVLALISNNDILLKNMDYYISQNVSHVICGNESLIDKEVISYVEKYKIPHTIIELEKNVETEQAYKIRNDLVSDYADEFTLFWNGKDESLMQVADMCRHKGKRVFMVQVINHK